MKNKFQTEKLLEIEPEVTQRCRVCGVYRSPYGGCCVARETSNCALCKNRITSFTTTQIIYDQEKYCHIECYRTQEIRSCIKCHKILTPYDHNACQWLAMHYNCSRLRICVVCESVITPYSGSMYSKSCSGSCESIRTNKKRRSRISFK